MQEKEQTTSRSTGCIHERNGVTVTNDFHEDMKQIMKETESQMLKNSPTTFTSDQ